MRLWHPTVPSQRIDKKSKRNQSARPRGRRSHEILKPILKMLREKIPGKFGAILLVYVASLVGKIKITTILARLGGEMGGLFSAKKFDKMFDNQVRFGLWCIVASCWTQLMKYLEKIVSINVRTIIYENLHNRYFNAKTNTM